MAAPLLIDTDMGIDDAVATCLALFTRSYDVRAIVGVGGNVPVDQAVMNIRRLLTAVAPSTAGVEMPAVARGLDQRAAGLPDRRSQFGPDGFARIDLPADERIVASDFRDTYRDVIGAETGRLHILALGPLTNIAALLDEEPEIMSSVRQIHLTGGAVWTKGDAASFAEFNFLRDPAAAGRVLASGLPITVTPLDVTRLVCLDESHVAHLAASGRGAAALLARLLRYSLEQETEPGHGRTYVADAVTTGSLLWPDLFMKTRMRLEVVTDGAEAGRSQPSLGGNADQRVDLLTAVNAVDFLENLLESLCQETFVV